MIKREDIDRTTVVTQTAKAGSSDLYATMPWVARLNPKAPRRLCEGYCYGRNKKCKAKATLVYIDLQNRPRFLCGSHAHDEYVSMYGLSGENAEGKRVAKFFDDHVQWSDKAKADIAEWNAQVDNQQA